MNANTVRRYLDLHDDLIAADARADKTGSRADRRYAESISEEMAVIRANASAPLRGALDRALSDHIDARVRAR